jgi:maltose O-acetyltransferase
MIRRPHPTGSLSSESGLYGCAMSSPGGPPEDRKSQRERMLAGDLYIANDPELARGSERALALVQKYNRSSPSDGVARRRILLELLGSLGEETEIRPPFYCDYGSQIHVGSRTFVNFGLVALDVARIDIGDDVQIGPRVQLLTPLHPLEPEARRAKWERAEPITIGDNAWLGGGVIVCPGVSVGADTVVGAGAVVTRDLPAGVFAAGVPARVVRSLVEN